MITSDAAKVSVPPEGAGAAGDPLGTLTAAYLALLFFGMPLTMHNGYFDITETKHLYFLLVSGCYVLSMGILRLARGRREGTGRGLAVPDVCVLAFVAAFLLSSLLSGRMGEALTGQYNRYQGLLTVGLYAAVYFCVSRHYAFFWWDGAALVAGFCGVCLLAVLNDFSLDPLGVFANLRPMDRHRYLSTLGNINFYGGYLSVLYPVILTRWCFAAERWETWLYGVGVACGALGAAPSGSDSLGLALLAAGLLLPLFCMGNAKALRRFFLCVPLFLLTVQLYGLAAGWWGTRFYPPFFLRLLRSPWVTGGLVALCALFLLALRRGDGSGTARWKKTYGIALFALFFTGCLFLLLVNTAFSERSFGAFDRFLKFNEHWGTDRGKIFAYCLRLYGDFTPLQKLFGAGPGCLYALDAAHPLFSDAVLDSAHSEYLHYLLTVGVFGLAAYGGLLLATAATVLRHKKRNPAAMGFLLGVICYGAQALVSIAQPVSTPFLFVLAALCVGAANRAGQAGQ